jgi:hypothetical protein
MKDNVIPVKKSWVGKMGALFSRFIGWIAKGYEGNLPCNG